jgi:hypothetical protein
MILYKYIRNILISVDQLGNTLLSGDPDEIISSRCAKVIKTCYLCRVFCYIANKIDPNHREKSVELDEGKRLRKK